MKNTFKSCIFKSLIFPWPSCLMRKIFMSLYEQFLLLIHVFFFQTITEWTFLFDEQLFNESHIRKRKLHDIITIYKSNFLKIVSSSVYTHDMKFHPPIKKAHSGVSGK